MKIMANIPVEKVCVGLGMHSFRHEVLEVDVLTVIRSSATRNPFLNRWQYMAIIRAPKETHPDAPLLEKNGTLRVNIWRTGKNGLNPKWVPPAFPDGKCWVEVGR